MGRFQPGQSGNPGGRPSTRKAELDNLIDSVWTLASRKKVIKKLVEDAESGNHEARSLLLAYTYGKPTDRKEITGADGAPLAPVQFFNYDAAVATLTSGSEDDPETPE